MRYLKKIDFRIGEFYLSSVTIASPIENNSSFGAAMYAAAITIASVAALSAIGYNSSILAHGPSDR